MCGYPQAKSKQFTTEAHWHLSWNATPPHTHTHSPPHPHVCDSSGKPMLQHCMQAAICAPSQVPQDKGPYYTSQFSHISSTISQYSWSDSPTETFSFTWFRDGKTRGWVSFTLRELDYCSSFGRNATIMTDTGEKPLPHAFGLEK